MSTSETDAYSKTNSSLNLHFEGFLQHIISMVNLNSLKV